METKQKLYVYERREMWVLVGLAATVTVFAFTLGLHLGKRVGSAEAQHAQGGAPGAPLQPVETQADALPSTQEFSDQSKSAQQAADEALNQSLHEEVARTGLKLEVARQVELPEETRGKGGATTLESERKKSQTPPAATPSAAPSATGAPARKLKASLAKLTPSSELSQAVAEQSIPALSRSAPEGRFTLQVGSFPTLDEASTVVGALDQRGVKPFMRSVDLKTKGTWYRVYTGGFATRAEAERLGQELRSKQWIKTFVISKLSD